MTEDGSGPPRITALLVEEVAALLSRVGSKHVTPDRIREHIAAGAPTNVDGSVNLVHYAAWLVRSESLGA